jgi:hypothetical protein
MNTVYGILKTKNPATQQLPGLLFDDGILESRNFRNIPTFPGFSRYKLVCNDEIGNLHVVAIPKQFLSSVEFALVALAQHPASNSQVTHEDGFSERTGIVET